MLSFCIFCFLFFMNTGYYISYIQDWNGKTTQFVIIVYLSLFRWKTFSYCFFNILGCCFCCTYNGSSRVAIWHMIYRTIISLLKISFLKLNKCYCVGVVQMFFFFLVIANSGHLLKKPTFVPSNCSLYPIVLWIILTETIRRQAMGVDSLNVFNMSEIVTCKP